MLPPALLLLAVSAAAAQETPPADLAVMEAPSEAEIEAAYGERIASLNARSRQVLGDADAELMLITLEDVKKLRCDGLDRVGVQFDCRVERRLRQADRRPTTDVVNLWLSYEDGRWIAR